jgi:hypothetical protein
MGKVLSLKKNESLICGNCFDESREGTGKPMWDLTLPFDENCVLYMTVYRSGWSKNQTIQKTTANGEERITFNETMYLCPVCNHHSTD